MRANIYFVCSSSVFPSLSLSRPVHSLLHIHRARDVQSNSHADDHSDREEDDLMREECESSDEGVNVNAHTNENGTAIDYARSPKHNSENTNIG